MPFDTSVFDPSVIDLVIFDCDGVLVDSEALVIEVEAEWLTEAGFPVTTDDIAERYVGLSYVTMGKAVEADFGRPVPEGLLERIQAHALASFPERLQPIAGIDDLLSESTQSRCLASGSDLDRIGLSLAVTGLAPHFTTDRIFSSQMVEHGKPAPDIFLLAAASIGVDPNRCLVIEDSPHGVTAGIAAGMTVVGFVGGGHARPSLGDRLTSAGAIQVVATAAELRAFVS